MIEVREYGGGREIVLVHGGPGAAGYLAPLARELADSHRVLEPLQRGSGGERLTVAVHVADLAEVIESSCDSAPVVVGHSWGAMLALAFAAAHPAASRSLVLISCGTFDAASRAALLKTRDARTDEATKGRLAEITRTITDADERFAAIGRLYEDIDSHDLLPHDDEPTICDDRAYRESWGDMMRLEREAVHPAAFARIACPVTMIHGDRDPHPGELVRASLAPHVAELEYRELRRCGHYPWYERHARGGFLAALRAAL